MANNRKYIKLSLSTLLLGLLLFLSCDDRNPVSSQGGPVTYDMNLEIKNSECEANNVDCDNTSAYAALNTYDQLEIVLDFDALLTACSLVLKPPVPNSFVVFRLSSIIRLFILQ